MPLLLLLLACLPLREHHRPELSGQVRAAGAPLVGARVEACTWSTWFEFDCARSVSAVTDAQGRYSLPGWSTFPTPLLGESPLNETLVTVCGEGAMAAALVGGGRAPLTVDLELGAPLVRAGDPFRTKDAEAMEAARSRCEDQPGQDAPAFTR